MPDRLLLVEDDPRIRGALVLGLADEGYEVVEASSGESALRLIEQEEFDVVLLDLMLPGMDGFSVCRTVRARGDLPITMITARSGSEDVVRGLEAGADDYVTKPVVASELAARIRPHPGAAAPGPPRAGGTGGDTGRRRGDPPQPRDGDPRRPGRAPHPHRAAAAHRAGHRGLQCGDPGTTAGAGLGLRLLRRHSVDVHVRRLRRKVEDDPSDPKLVLTVRGLGYRIAG